MPRRYFLLTLAPPRSPASSSLMPVPPVTAPSIVAPRAISNQRVQTTDQAASRPSLSNEHRHVEGFAQYDRRRPPNHPRRAPRERLRGPVRPRRDAQESDRTAPLRPADRRRCHGLRRDRHPADRERDPLRPGHYL